MPRQKAKKKAPTRQQWTPLEEGRYYLRLMMSEKLGLQQLIGARMPDKLERATRFVRLAQEEDRYVQKHGVVQRCHFCGCTEDDCQRCVERTGFPCSWHDTKTCSACVEDAAAHFAK